MEKMFLWFYVFLPVTLIEHGNMKSTNKFKCSTYIHIYLFLWWMKSIFFKNFTNVILLNDNVISDDLCGWLDGYIMGPWLLDTYVPNSKLFQKKPQH